jgi:hypothetical protein
MRASRGARLAVGAALGAAALAVGLGAHVRLINPSNGNALYWNDPTSIGIVVNSAGSDDIGDGSHETALRLAIQEWNTVTGTTAELIEDTSDASQARTDWESSGIHLMLFDETNASGYFPSGSGTVAITPIWFFSSGRISDADVLFNGNGFAFTTRGEPGAFDVGDVATHELGHLLGLDHTGVAGGTMYPYVDTSLVEHRSVCEDDAKGMRDAYPQGSWGSITGTITRASDGSNVAGALMVALDDQGRTAASILSRSNGTFTLRGLDDGTYSVYADPLDEPVSSANLGDGITIETDFQSTRYGSTATITGGGSAALGALAAGADAALNLGRNSDTFPVRVIAGQSTTVTLRGIGLFPTSTLICSDPDFVLGVPSWFGTQVSVQVTLPSGEAPGHADLTVEDASGCLSILPGALEVTPVDPIVTSVVPGLGSAFGGTSVTIGGSGFRAGAHVVIGDQIYTDGEVGGCTVVDDANIVLVTAATLDGLHDVVVIDDTGVEGRSVDAFQVAAIPVVSTVFPTAGAELGGTSVVISGAGFQPGLSVRIDGVDQSVTLEGSSTIRFATTAGTVTGAASILEIENPDGGLATSAFTYVSPSDPTIALLTPAVGSSAGGTTISLGGSDLAPGCVVSFDADPDTGLGGTSATSVTFVDASTLTVVTPAHSKGSTSVMVSDPSTGQATVIAAGFTFQSSSGGGGGGCYTIPLRGPGDPREALPGGSWIAALFALALLRSRRAHLALAHARA